MKPGDVKPDAPDLLIGSLAVRLGLISIDTLVAAIKCWLPKRATPLVDVLVDMQALDASNAALLSAIVDQQLISPHVFHGEHLPADDEVLEALRDIDDVDVDATLVGCLSAATRPFVSDSSADPISGSSAPAESSPQSLAASDLESSRYRVVRPHAEGGLGEVVVALDQQLNREVAVKQIKPAYADKQDSRARFLLEAEVTAGLEHPGIVPVYGLGTDSSGRPYYAMRLIRGENLQEDVDNFHDKHTHARSVFANDDQVAYDSGRLFQLRKLLSHFIDICQTIEYAHSRGILHRDIKPANVVLGSFGETMVVDWGLAKRASAGPGDDSMDALGEASSTDSGAGSTRLGSKIGTPAFMSPEQASGETDKISTQSDIYSLGATLYYVLLGQAPLANEPLSLQEMLQRVSKGAIPSVRSINPTVPLALDAICRKAMARNPTQRYINAADLAEDLERWLADQPVSAMREPLLGRISRWLRHHRTLAASAATLCLVSAIGFGVYSTIVGRKNTELARANQALGQQKAALEESNAALQSAQQETAHQTQITEAVNKFLAEDLIARASPNQEPDRDIKLRTVLDQAASALSKRFKDEPAVEASIRQTLGKAYRELGELAEAEQLLRVAVELCEEHLGSEDRHALSSKSELGKTLQAQGELEQAQAIHEAVLEVAQRTYGDAHRLTLSAKHNLALAYQWQGKYEQALQLNEDVLAAYRAAREPDDSLVLATLNNQATLKLSVGDFPGGDQALQEVIELSGKLNGPEHPYTLVSQANRSIALLLLGELESAQLLLENTISVQRRLLGDEHPDTLGSRSTLVAVYRKRGKLDDAKNASEELLEIRRRTLGDEHPDTLVSWHNLALSLQELGEYAEAEDLTVPLLATKKRVLGVAHPDTLTTQQNLARLYEQTRRFEEGRQLYEETLQTQREVLGDKHPATLKTLQNLALLLLKTKQWTDAQPLFESLLAVAESTKDPALASRQGGYQSALAKCALHLGSYNAAVDRASKASEFHRRENADSWLLGDAQTMLGAALRSLERFDEAEQELLAAHAQLSAIQTDAPEWDKANHDNLTELVRLYEDWQRPTDAERWQAELSGSD